MPNKVTDPNKIITDPVLLSVLAKQGIDKDYVEFYQDYAPAYVNGKRVKGQSPYGKFYRDLLSNKRFMVVSGLPMVDADGIKIEAGWRVAGINYFSEKNNLFRAKVQGTDVELIVRNDQPDGRKAGEKLSYKPQLFLNDVEQAPGQPTLLPVDPLNPNYLENTLEWDYGICKRRLRIIEGSILGSWLFAQKPAGEIRIKYNQTGDYRLRLGQFKISDDEELVKPEDFDRLAEVGGYPVTISDSATFYPDAHAEVSSVDGYVIHQQDAQTWATIQGGAGTSAYDSLTTPFYAEVRSSTTTNTWLMIMRVIILFDTSGLPDTAVISAATLAVYGTSKADPVPWNIDACVYASAPASNVALAAGDYDSLETTELSDVITYANWLIANPYWNTFTLNATGRGLISLTGVSKFGLREHTHDAHNSEPAYASNKDSYLGCYSSDKGNGYKPTLVVTYTTPKPSSCMAAKLVAAGLI